MPNYPNPTHVRMAYDRDATVVVHINGSTVMSTLTTGEKNAFNDETEGQVFAKNNNGATNYIAAIFPEARTITAWFWRSNRNSGSATKTFQYSLDTTNGVDGTWANAGTVGDATTVRPDYRTPAAATGQPIVNVKGVRVVCPTTGAGSDQFYAFHIYGYKTAVTDRLALWHPTLDQPLSDFPAWFDWEDKPRSSTNTKSFRVKNLSATLTATTITASMDELNVVSPTLASQTRFRYNGGAYGATASLASLAPGTISEVFDVELALTATAFLSLASQRYIVSAASWA